MSDRLQLGGCLFHFWTKAYMNLGSPAEEHLHYTAMFCLGGCLFSLAALSIVHHWFALSKKLIMNNNKLLWLVLHTMTGLIFLGLVYLLFFEESLFEHMANYLCLSLCLAIIQLLFLYVLEVLAIKKLKPETRRQRLLLLATIVCGLAFQAATDILWY